MTREEMIGILKGLEVLPFFPSSEGSMKALAHLVESMMTSDDQVEWLVNRMTGGLYAEWPGPAEVRAVFTNKFKPADGINGYSSVYPDGIPSEKREPPPMLALPPGVEASVDPVLEASIHALAERLNTNRTGRRRRQVPGIPFVEVPPKRRITQADVDRETERLRDERARRELGEDGDADSTTA
jgi:hypothetical protein